MGNCLAPAPGLSESEPPPKPSLGHGLLAKSLVAALRRAVTANRSLFGQHVDSCHQLFDIIDTDGTGGITRRELEDGLSRLGYGLNAAQLDFLFEQLDANDSGVIERDQFIWAIDGFEKEDNN